MSTDRTGGARERWQNSFRDRQQRAHWWGARGLVAAQPASSIKARADGFTLSEWGLRHLLLGALWWVHPVWGIQGQLRVRLRVESGIATSNNIIARS